MIRYLPHSAQGFPRSVHNWKVDRTIATFSSWCPHWLNSCHILFPFIPFVNLSSRRGFVILPHLSNIIFRTQLLPICGYDVQAPSSIASRLCELCGELVMAMSIYCDGSFDFSHPLPCRARPFNSCLVFLCRDEFERCLKYILRDGG